MQIYWLSPIECIEWNSLGDVKVRDLFIYKVDLGWRWNCKELAYENKITCRFECKIRAPEGWEKILWTSKI